MVTTTERRSGLRRNRNWQLYWLATSVSVVGDSFFDITVMLWVVTEVARGKSWAPAAASGVLLAAAIPYLVAGPVAGVYVDRWNRRRIMLTADACRMILIASLLILPAMEHTIGVAVQLAVIYGVVAAESCFAQFFNPCRLALLGLVVSGPDLPRASGRIQAASSLANVIGPPLAGTVLFTAGVQWALIIDAASFAASFLAIRRVRLSSWGSAASAPASASFRSEFHEGLRFFAANRVVLTVCAVVTVATIGTGALNSIEVFFVTTNLHAAATWLGYMFAAYGIGSVLGNLLAGKLARRGGTTRVFSISIVIAGVTLVAFSRTTSFQLAAAIMVTVGVAIGVANALCAPLILAATPQNLIGRMSAVFNPVQQLASLAAIAAAGLLASTALKNMHAVVGGITFGPFDTIIGVSGVLILGAGLISVQTLRAYGRSSNLPQNHPRAY